MWKGLTQCFGSLKQANTVEILITNIWIMNFNLLPIQMHSNSSLFRSWLEYQTKSVFIQAISLVTYDPKYIFLVGFSSHDLINWPFNHKTGLDHSNTELDFYSDPHCRRKTIFDLPVSIQKAKGDRWDWTSKKYLPKHQAMCQN